MEKIQIISNNFMNCNKISTLLCKPSTKSRKKISALQKLLLLSLSYFHSKDKHSPNF